MNGGEFAGIGRGGPRKPTTGGGGRFPTNGIITPGIIGRPPGIIDWWITDKPPSVITGGGGCSLICTT